MTRRLPILLALLLPTAGCSMAQWRVFQTKVPANIEKPPAQAEGEKRGAAYIRARSAPPVGDPSQAVRDIYPAAEALAASLGEPAKPVAVEDKDAVIAALRAGNRAKDGQLDAWKAFGRKYAGLPLEGTGINLAGPVGLLGLVAVVAACIACPALGYAVLRVLPLLWGYFRRTTQAVNELAQSNPDAADKLKARLSSRLDLAHKKLVGRWAKQAKPVAT